MDLNVLALRKRLSIFEAAGLLSGNRQQIVELMREAIEAGELSAVEVVRHGIYSADNGGWRPGGAIDYMQTTLEYAEFQRWFDATGLQTPLTAPAKTPVTTDERALMRAAARFVNPTLGDANRSLEELAHFEQARIEGERAKAKARAEGLAAGMAKELLSPEPRAERKSVIAMPTKQGVIELPAGTKHVRFEELPHLIASALVPIDESSSDGHVWRFSEAEVMLLDELNEAVSGELPVKNPLTFGPYMPNGGVRLADCVVLVQDLRLYVAERGLSVEVPETEAEHETERAPLVETALEPVPIKPWKLKPVPERLPGYRWPLYQFLKAAHVDGLPCPTASDVLTAWAANPPPGMLVELSGEHRDELQYKTVEGVQKWAKRKQIQGAINGLLDE